MVDALNEFFIPVRNAGSLAICLSSIDRMKNLKKQAELPPLYTYTFNLHLNRRKAT